MNLVYPNARSEFLRGNLDWETDTFRLFGFAAQVYDPSHTVLGDITSGPHGYAIEATITGRSVAVNGEAYANDVTFVAAPAGDVIVAFVVAQRTLDYDTARLIAYIDLTSTDTAISIDTADTDLVVTWASYVFSI